MRLYTAHRHLGGTLSNHHIYEVPSSVTVLPMEEALALDTPQTLAPTSCNIQTTIGCSCLPAISRVHVHPWRFALEGSRTTAARPGKRHVGT